MGHQTRKEKYAKANIKKRDDELFNDQAEREDIARSERITNEIILEAIIHTQ